MPPVSSFSNTHASPLPIVNVHRDLFENLFRLCRQEEHDLNRGRDAEVCSQPLVSTYE
jgi:hypothetical protein